MDALVGEPSTSTADTSAQHHGLDEEKALLAHGAEADGHASDEETELDRTNNEYAPPAAAHKSAHRRSSSGASASAIANQSHHRRGSSAAKGQYARIGAPEQVHEQVRTWLPLHRCS